MTLTVKRLSPPFDPLYVSRETNRSPTNRTISEMKNSNILRSAITSLCCHGELRSAIPLRAAERIFANYTLP